MKAKDYIVCGLLAAILAVCCFTSYTVIQEQKKQTEYLESVQFFAGEVTQTITARNLKDQDLDAGYFINLSWDIFNETIDKFREKYPELMQERTEALLP